MSSRAIRTVNINDYMEEHKEQKEPQCDIEAVFNILINASRSNGGQSEKTVINWDGRRGKFKARLIGEQTYLVQYSVDGSSGQRNHLFEVNLIA